MYMISLSKFNFLGILSTVQDSRVIHLGFDPVNIPRHLGEDRRELEA
jgi:hypothetical protein